MRSGSATDVPPNFWTTRDTRQRYQRLRGVPSRLSAAARVSQRMEDGATGALRFRAVPNDKRQRQRANAAQKAAAARAAQQRRTTRRRGLIAGGAIIAIVAIVALFIAQST